MSSEYKISHTVNGVIYTLTKSGEFIENPKQDEIHLFNDLDQALEIVVSFQVKYDLDVATGKHNLPSHYSLERLETA